MCGLVGVFDSISRRDVGREILHRMNESQLHRGPDGGGLHLEPGVGLGHRRLAIIDVAAGHQPLFNEDGSVAVVFNGEIYNYQELIPELAGRGHVFKTRSDTEVIVHAWEEWGSACVERFRGMFAFALWDRSSETLFLARDRLGVKPLFYSLLPDGMLLFGSELKALIAHGALATALDPHAIEEYFALGYVPEPRTIFVGTHKLPPGHTLTIRRGKPLPPPACYWDVEFTLDSTISDDEAQEELVRRLRESVRLRMISEVPLGAFLSGGVDSSAVVASMATQSTSPVKTCSISFADPAFDESAYAREVAARYNTDHFVEQVDSDDYSLIDELVGLYDEPYADSSAIPTYRVCQLARTRVTVALSGDGGDESFGGYRRYRMHMNEDRIRSMLPLTVRRPLFGALGSAYPKLDWAPRVLRAKSTFESLARDSVQGYFHSVSIFRDPMRRRLFSDAFRRQTGSYNAVEVFRGHAARYKSEDVLGLVQYLDLKTYLVGDINTKVDRASMAHSLEVREPLMDHPLVEWLAALPSSLKVRDGEGKWLLKKAMEPHLPHDVLYRRKMGFAVPLARWFRGPLRSTVRTRLLEGELLKTGYFNRSYLTELVDDHQSGRRDYSAPLWTLLMFEGFLRKLESRCGSGAVAGISQQAFPALARSA
ncbi:MAG: amidotransferase 1, exosortase A system-associated [Betaproteobacteria bacterium]|nr:amidotransferase 1, exosortase A system-associated [Betaproteobacteria bacterium]